MTEQMIPWFPHDTMPVPPLPEWNPWDRATPLKEECQQYYSEQKNWFTRGPFLLVSQIMAQRTKINPWEFVITKPCILSFVVLNLRTLALAHYLIYILQSSRFSESIFLLAPGLALFGLYHLLHPSGHAPNQVSTNPLSTLSDPTLLQSSCAPAGGTS